MSLLYSQVAEGGANWLPTLVMAVFMAVFLGFAWWAWRPANRERMEAYGRMPLDDETEPSGIDGLSPRGVR